MENRRAKNLSQKFSQMSGLVACLNDPVILVQRNTLEFLLLGFPMHTNLLTKTDLIKLVTNGLNTILRRDMSLNRRLYSWLLGSEVSNQQKRLTATLTTDSPDVSDKSYFDQYSKNVLIEAIKCTLRISLQYTPVDLKPYKIMVSLLDKGKLIENSLRWMVTTFRIFSGNRTSYFGSCYVRRYPYHVTVKR